MSMKEISKTRFEALTYSVTPFIKVITQQREWYADHTETVLGTVILDLTDNDWSWVVLGRDVNGLFKAVDHGVSLTTSQEARHTLHAAMHKVCETGQTIFPQDKVPSRKNLILVPVVPESALHPSFRVLTTQNEYSPAREIIKEIAYAFVDIDGNYIKDFQTTGFSARLWELYLFAFLHEQQFQLDRTHNRPDFCGEKWFFSLSIEACTVNPTDGQTSAPPKTEQEILTLNQNYMPIKYGSALHSKMKKRYWEMEHVKGRPFALAIHDFHAEDSMVWSASALDSYLYGLRATARRDENGRLHVTETPIKEHVLGDKRIASVFFSQLDAENVSAVLSSNAATISKFNRMGKLAGFGDPRVKMLRIGTVHNPDPNASEPDTFCVEVKPESYTETWSDSLRVLHNPNALMAIPEATLPGCAHIMLAEEKRFAHLPDQFVHSSRTLILNPTDDRQYSSP